MEEKKEALDHEKMAAFSVELILDITKVIVTKPQSREMSAGAVIALAHVLTMLTIKIAGRESAMDIMSMALSKAFESVLKSRKEMGFEQDTNTQTPGS